MNLSTVDAARVDFVLTLKPWFQLTYCLHCSNIGLRESAYWVMISLVTAIVAYAMVTLSLFAVRQRTIFDNNA